MEEAGKSEATLPLTTILAWLDEATVQRIKTEWARVSGKENFSEKTFSAMQIQFTSPLVLRLRKDTSFAVSYANLMNHYKEDIQPLFEPTDLVQQNLFPIPQSLITTLNTHLKAAETSNHRAPHRHGTYLSTKEPHGLLLESMSPTSPSTTFFELKPKWLVQSPSAPSDSLRCRTCALREMRSSTNKSSPSTDDPSSSSSSSSSFYCPLDLLSPSKPTLRDALSAAGAPPSTLPLLTQALFQSPVLTRLRAAQSAHNQVGMTDFVLGRYDTLGMTLRDCTCFVRISSPSNNPDTATAITTEEAQQKKKEEGGEIEVKLADLDFKSPSGGKLQRWYETERKLIAEGWYEGKEENGRGSVRMCDLGWGWKGGKQGMEGLEGAGLMNSLV
ncbi:MAG: hypothetical protein Q9227_003151 [Pyrenula ochraceoflavens]